MLQPALRISDNEILLLSALVSVSYSQRGEDALLVLELCNHKSVTFTGREAESSYQRIVAKLEVV